MKRLDFNRDGEISEEEIYRVLAPFDSTKKGGKAFSSDKITLASKPSSSVYETVEKIKKAASKYQSLKHFVSAMMRRYDTDGDGSLNFKELFDGLNHDNVKLSKDECLALMKHIDVDCDGQVTRDEIFNALLVDPRHQRSHHFAKVNVDHLLKRIKQGAEKFKSLEDFCRHIFTKMDKDRSGTLSFSELSQGLTDMGIEITNKEKHELMKSLDDDADGEIAFEEFYQGLSNVKRFS
jgi:Ca2+-binding EF-hand superfamily protein